MKLSEVEINIVGHATEDEILLADAVEANFKIPAEIKKAMGHWKNPIYMIKGLGKREEALRILKQVSKLVKPNIKSQCEKNMFFVRISKARLVDNQIAPGDDVQLVFRFKGHAPDEGKVAAAVGELLKA